MNFKTALLAVAALGVAGTAQAADLAKKAPAAANYVKVCDAYGEGFFYIPGSETCLKVGGYVRAEYRLYSNNRSWATGLGWANRTDNGITTRARAQLQLDARTNTEMGLLRSYIEADFTVDSGAATVTSLNKAFIQFGGLTAGRAQSFFDFWTGNTYGSFFEPAHSDTWVNLLGYTFAFGNGITASVAIEDPSSGNAGRRFAFDDGTSFNGAGAYAGVKTPDVVANVNITQSWGSAQLMAALHDDYSTVNGKLGWAVGGGVTVNLPMLGDGDTVSLQGAYAKGANSYAGPDFSGAWNYDFTGGGAGASVQQTAAWSIGAGLTHNWTKSVSTSLEASYAKLDAFGSRDDYSQIDLQGNVVWAPVSGLAIGAEVEYRKVDYSRAGLADRSGLVGLLRVQRNF